MAGIGGTINVESVVSHVARENPNQKMENGNCTEKNHLFLPLEFSTLENRSSHNVSKLGGAVLYGVQKKGGGHR